jgi:hypothetical protein
MIYSPDNGGRTRQNNREPEQTGTRAGSRFGCAQPDRNFLLTGDLPHIIIVKKIFPVKEIPVNDD